LVVGKPLPDVTLTGLNGSGASLPGLRSHKLLIFFWGSW
jgi:peroxiredoxin